MKSILFNLIIVLTVTTTYTAEYTLQQCKELAIENNTLVKNASLEVDASGQLKKEILTKFFPKIDAQAVTFKMKDPLIDADFPGGNLPVYDGNPANIGLATQFAYFPEIPLSFLEKGTIGIATAVQPVFAGGRIFNGYKLAGIGQHVNKEKHALSKNEVTRITEEKYWQIVALMENKKTLDIYRSLLDTLSKEANDAFNAGLINRGDIMKVSIKQNEIRTNELQLENGIYLAKMSLCNYIGIPFDSTLSLVDSIENFPVPSEVYMDADSALKQRHEYVMLGLAEKAERFQTKVKLGEYLPQIGIGVGGLYTRNIAKDGSDAFVFASAAVPISGWWEASHALKERKIREKISKQSIKNSIELLSLQIEKEWRELVEEYKKIKYAEQVLKQEDENLKINSDNFNAGIINISDMLEAQALYKKGRDNLLNAKIGYKNKLIAYMNVTGR